MSIVQREYPNFHAMWSFGGIKFSKGDQIRVMLKVGTTYDGQIVAGPTTSFDGITIKVGPTEQLRISTGSIQRVERPDDSPGGSAESEVRIR